MGPLRYAAKKQFRAPQPYVPPEMQYSQDFERFLQQTMALWRQLKMTLGLTQDAFTDEDEESLRHAAVQQYRGAASPRRNHKLPGTVSVSMPVSTQFSMLTFLACSYHVLMFFSIITIENYQFGRQLEMKKAFLKMSQEHKQVLQIGAAAAHSQLINNMMAMLQEQQDAFM